MIKYTILAWAGFILFMVGLGVAGAGDHGAWLLAILGLLALNHGRKRHQELKSIAELENR